MRLPRFRFSLRMFLILSTLAACGLGWLATHFYQSYLHSASLQAIHEAGGVVRTNEEDRTLTVVFGRDEFNDDDLKRLMPHLRLLTDMRQLSLVEVNITDQSLNALAVFEQLDTLYLIQTQVSEEGVAQLREKMPDTIIETHVRDRPASGLAARDIFRHAMIALEWSPDGRTLATGSGDGTVRLWRLEESQPYRQWQAHDDWAFSLAFSPDSQSLASGGGDNVIRLWDLSTGELQAELVGHQDDVHAVAFTPNGDCIVSAGDDMTVRVWEVASGKCLRELTGHQGTIPGLAVSLTGELVASASRDGTVRLWDIAGNEPTRVLAGHTDDVMSVVFDPAGGRLASGSYDGTVRLWDLASGETLATLPGREGEVYSLAFSSNGTQLAAASEHGVRMWDLASGDSSVVTDQANVAHAAYQPGGNLLATTNANGELRLMDRTSGAPLAIYRTRPGEETIFEPLLIAAEK